MAKAFHMPVHAATHRESQSDPLAIADLPSDSPTGGSAISLDGQVLKADGSDGSTFQNDEAALEFIIDGGGSAITTGIKGDLEVAFACTIKSARLLADQTGSIVIDIWKDSYANFPPTDGDSITASAPPTISSGVKDQDLTLTGWTKTLSKGDILRFTVDSITSIERCTVSLAVDKT